MQNADGSSGRSGMVQRLPPPSPLKSMAAFLPEPAKLMVAGGISGVLAKTATAPLGRLTILYQVGGEKVTVVGKVGACRHGARSPLFFRCMPGVAKRFRVGSCRSVFCCVPVS